MYVCIGKLNRGISVVDTIEILRGSLLEGDEYRKAAILGWAVELVRCPFLRVKRALVTLGSKSFLNLMPAPSVFPRRGRYDGRVDYATQSALLVPRPQSREYRNQRLVHARSRYIPPPQGDFPQGQVLCRLARAVPRGKLVIYLPFLRVAC